MELLKIFGLTLLIHTVLSREMQVSISSNEVYVGDTVTITCQMTKEEDSDSLVMHWVRKVPENSVDIELGANINVNDNFRNERYSISHNMDLSSADGIPDPMEFYFKITGVTPADSGQIGCRSESVEVFTDLNVLVDIQTLEIGSALPTGEGSETYENNTERIFEEGDSRRFWCKANGAFPAPEMQIFLGSEDITDQFERRPVLQEVGAIDGLKELSYNVELYNSNLIIDYSADDKRLECRASVPGENKFGNHSKGIQIDLSGYKPKFKCEAEVSAVIYQPDLNITCLVVADPPISDTFIQWETYSENNETTSEQTPPDENKKGVLSHTEPGSSDAETYMWLYIKRVFSQHFRAYVFQATNSLGTTKHTITIKEDIPTQPYTNEEIVTKDGCMSMTSSVLVTFILITLSIFMIHS